MELPRYEADSLEIYTNGVDKFKALFTDFRNAKKSINVEYFIFADDSISHLTLKELRDAVSRGVKVRLVIDGYKDWGRHYGYDGPRLDTLRTQGIEAYIFDPWRHPYLKHIARDHRKIVVIDDSIGYIGGLNIADYYINGKPEVYGGWRDTHLRLTGDAIKGLQNYFYNAFTFSGGEMPKPDVTPANNYSPNSNVDTANFKLAATTKLAATSKLADAKLQLAEAKRPQVVYFERSRESHAKKAETRRAIAAAFRSAQDTLRIVSPYFLPTHSVRKALVKAIDRGVNVQILFSKVGDEPILSVGNYHFSKRLIRHGAEVYLYRGSFHHSKIMMVDGEYSMVGSANLNSRSLRWDYEASCFVFDKDLTSRLTKVFEQDKLSSDTLTKEYYRQIPVKKRIFGWFVDRFLTPML